MVYICAYTVIIANILLQKKNVPGTNWGSEGFEAWLCITYVRPI